MIIIIIDSCMEGVKKNILSDFVNLRVKLYSIYITTAEYTGITGF